MPAYHRYKHRQLALDMGWEDDKVLMPNENGAIIKMYENGIKISKNKMNLQAILIDGK